MPDLHRAGRNGLRIRGYADDAGDLTETGRRARNYSGLKSNLRKQQEKQDQGATVCYGTLLEMKPHLAPVFMMPMPSRPFAMSASGICDDCDQWSSELEHHKTRSGPVCPKCRLLADVLMQRQTFAYD